MVRRARKLNRFFERPEEFEEESNYGVNRWLYYRLMIENTILEERVNWFEKEITSLEEEYAWVYDEEFAWIHGEEKEEGEEIDTEGLGMGEVGEVLNEF